MPCHVSVFEYFVTNNQRWQHWKHHQSFTSHRSYHTSHIIMSPSRTVFSSAVSVNIGKSISRGFLNQPTTAAGLRASYFLLRPCKTVLPRQFSTSRGAQLEYFPPPKDAPSIKITYVNSFFGEKREHHPERHWPTTDRQRGHILRQARSFCKASKWRIERRRRGRIG